MSNQRYTPEFKAEAVRQVTERGYTIAEVSQPRPDPDIRQDDGEMLCFAEG